MTRFLWVLLLAAGISPGLAQTSAPSADTTETTIRAALDKVGHARALNDKDFALAKVAAATWVFVGPCRGDALKLFDRSTPSISLVMNADPAVPYQAATLEMITMILRSTLGRPDQAYCDTVLGIAKDPLPD